MSAPAEEYFLDWFRRNKPVSRVTNKQLGVGWELLCKDVERYKSIPEFDVLIAEMNRRSSRTSFRASTLLSVIAIVVAIVAIWVK